MHAVVHNSQIHSGTQLLYLPRGATVRVTNGVLALTHAVYLAERMVTIERQLTAPEVYTLDAGAWLTLHMGDPMRYTTFSVTQSPGVLRELRRLLFRIERKLKGTRDAIFRSSKPSKRFAPVALGTPRAHA